MIKDKFLAKLRKELDAYDAGIERCRGINLALAALMWESKKDLLERLIDDIEGGYFDE